MRSHFLTCPSQSWYLGYGRHVWDSGGPKLGDQLLEAFPAPGSDVEVHAAVAAESFLRLGKDSPIDPESM